MAKRKTAVVFKGTEGQEQELHVFISECRNQEGALIPILQKAQDIYGYLPIEVQYIIAHDLEIPLETVYGVVSFYSHFTLNPRGVYNINVCMGTACYVKGASKIVEKLEEKLGIKNGSITPDGLFSMESTRCIGACALAPIMLVNEDVYGQVDPADVDAIIEKYKEKNGGQTA